MTAETILARLDGVRQTGPAKWLARCPAHDDRSPSLSIRETDDGRTLIHCFGGCAVQDVVAAVGLDLADLFPSDPIGRPAKIPRYNARELLPLVVTEATILRLAMGDVLAGNGLSLADRRRVEQAMTAIEMTAREVLR